MRAHLLHPEARATSSLGWSVCECGEVLGYLSEVVWGLLIGEGRCGDEEADIKVRATREIQRRQQEDFASSDAAKTWGNWMDQASQAMVRGYNIQWKVNEAKRRNFAYLYGGLGPLVSVKDFLEETNEVYKQPYEVESAKREEAYKLISTKLGDVEVDRGCRS